MMEVQTDGDTLIDELIQSGETSQAVKTLAQMAVTAARSQDFNRADALRNRLYEVDSMALEAIVSVNDIIDAEKSRYLESNRGGLWQRFSKAFSREEANALLLAFKETEVAADHILLQQGKTNNQLYFVSQGQLKEYYDGPTKQMLIRHLGPGHVVGAETFFSVNVCTLSVATLSAVRLTYLTQERYDKLVRQFPFFAEQFKKICLSGRKTFDLLRQKGLDRRQFKRINYQTMVWFQVLSAGRQKGMQKPITGEMWDISKAGLSFYFQYKDPAAVSALLGKTLGIRFNLPYQGKLKQVPVTGIVQGVQNHPLDEFSVHVQLNRRFSDEAFNIIRGIAENQ